MALLLRVFTIETMQRIRFLMAICIALGVSLLGKSLTAGPLYPASISPALPGTASAKPAPGKFLVARRALDGSHFAESIIYLIEHDGDGTLGLIVNRQSNIRLSETMPDIEDERAKGHALNYGGPVGIQMMLILVRGKSVPEAMAYVAEDVYVGSGRSILEAILATELPANEVRIFVGYSGWAAGQLDSELDRGSWHVITADTNAIFSSETDMLWDQLIEQLEPIGIQVDNERSPPNLALLRFPYSTTDRQKPVSPLFDAFDS